MEQVVAGRAAPDERAWLHRYATCVAAATLLLIIAGGLVTSTGSGLAVPDWPLSYGMLFPPMVGGILFEHGHRMVAAAVGLMTIVLAVWLWRAEPRAWVRRLGLVAVVGIVAQGLLGGLTVLLLLPVQVSVAHACLAQAFFCATVAIALATARTWRDDDLTTRSADRAPRVDRLRTFAITTTVFIYLQLALGAIVRHLGAGLAIPDFPLAFGGLIPPFFDTPIAVHFAHRIGAVIATALIIGSFVVAWRERVQRPDPVPAAWALLLLLPVQILLGGLAVWTAGAVIVTTAHVAVGALLLGSGVALVMQTTRGLTDHTSE